MSFDLQLANRRVLVTGATKGVGAAVWRVSLHAGAQVVATAAPAQPVISQVASLASRPNQLAATMRASPPKNQQNVLKCKSTGTSLTTGSLILVASPAIRTSGAAI